MNKQKQSLLKCNGIDINKIEKQ